MTERDFEQRQPREPGRAGAAYLPFVPSFGWRPGQSDFPVTLIAASDAFPNGRTIGGSHTRDRDLFPHVEVLSAPGARRVTPLRVLAALVIFSATVAASLTVFDRSDPPGDRAAGVMTETASPQTPTAEAQIDPDLRRPQPGFGGALPSPEDEPEPTPSETSSDATASAADPTPSAVSVLPGNGVVTVTARSEDTIISVAEKFDVAVSSLVWSNGISDPAAPLEEGTLIRVPREDGVIHEVSDGDTLDAIAERYGVDADAITGYGSNDIEGDSDLEEGSLLLVPGGTVADRQSLDEYTVREGDTLLKIASYYGLQPQTLVWANELPDPSLIHNGQELLIPPGDGALVEVVEGDTVEAIADRFGIEPDDIYDYAFNGLGGDGTLQAGQHLLAPGDFLPPLPEDSPLGAVQAGDDVEGPATGSFIWPTEGQISQEFSTGHLGVDIANEAWTPVNAMDGGVVIFAGWSDYGLGYAVGIDHGNGFQTWYGHFAAQPYVEEGQIIWQGGYLGPMGSTGRSTGPHLHLVVLEDGVYTNPLDYLE